jgi:3-methyladenine DNA glycosylase AlkD
MISPEQLAKRTIRELKAAADPHVAAGARAYFKAYDDVDFFGVKTPAIRRIERNLYEQIRGDWRFQDAVNYCDILIRRRELEAKNAGIFLLARYKKAFDKSLLTKIEGWLAGDHCGDWASVDSLSSAVIGPLIERRPELAPNLKAWTRKRNLWIRRAAAVGMIQSARRGKRLDEIYEIAESLFKYPEDLIHKAAGWLLREAGKTDAERLEDFLLTHGPRIPRTTLRYAIERFSPEKRNLLLARTKLKN